METHHRLINFVRLTNWLLLALAGSAGLVFAPREFAWGVIGGGLIVTINFHLLSRTLSRAFQPHRPASLAAILVKYYLRFVGSGVIIFFLLYGEFVDPVGLVIGLSIVVASIVLATLVELKTLF